MDIQKQEATQMEQGNYSLAGIAVHSVGAGSVDSCYAVKDV